MKTVLHSFKFLDRQIRDKLKRDPVLAFSQSIASLCRLWNVGSADDKTFHSAIVHPGNSYSIKEDVYLSVPVKFQNGSFCFLPDFKLQTFVEDIAKVELNLKSQRLKETLKEFLFQILRTSKNGFKRGLKTTRF